MNTLHLAPRRRDEPFVTVGADAVTDYLTFQIDGVDLLDQTEPRGVVGFGVTARRPD